MVIRLTERVLHEDGTPDLSEETVRTGAWDLCRAMMLLGIGFQIGYLSREDMVSGSRNVGRLIQQMYRSWGELYQSYYPGCKEWIEVDNPKRAEEYSSERREFSRKLLALEDGPCSIPFDTDLS